MTRKPERSKTKDAFLEMLKKQVEQIAADGEVSKRDRNNAIANGVKLLQIEHKINPGDTEDFFGKA